MQKPNFPRASSMSFIEVQLWLTQKSKRCPLNFLLLKVLICGHVCRGGQRKKHSKLGETTLGEFLPKAWKYIHSDILGFPTILRKKWELKTIFLFFTNIRILCLSICERVLQRKFKKLIRFFHFLFLFFVAHPLLVLNLLAFRATSPMINM